MKYKIFIFIIKADKVYFYYIYVDFSYSCLSLTILEEHLENFNKII